MLTPDESKSLKLLVELARKSSEDAQAAGYTWLEKVWAGPGRAQNIEKVEEKLKKLKKK